MNVIKLCKSSSSSSCARMIVCNQVMKFILDRIDKDERQAAKRRKKEEVVEAKRRLANASKLSSLLYRHKESLKMEILKKRALLDKELQLEAQVQTMGGLSNIYHLSNVNLYKLG